MRISTRSESWQLQEGYAEIVFDNQTRITIESPAQFRILTDDQIWLNYGKLYAVVPQQAYGFTVSTPNSKVIDLGTEYGVNADHYGNTEIHVIRGKTNLVSGFKGKKININISEGDARKLSAQSGQLEQIPVNQTLFVRQINSEHSFVWRGDNSIDLADIVGGGNGFGSGQRGSFINPVTGKWEAKTRLENHYDPPKTTEGKYLKIADMDMVDGIFVPDGGRGPVVISSQGHIFNEAPKTSGQFWSGVINVEKIVDQPISLNKVLFGTDEKPALFMHSNIGITFDLQAIQKLLANKSITQFSSRYGISESFLNVGEPYADFWVLVDGELRFSKKDVTLFHNGMIEIPLTEADRFLTLITTEGKEGTDDKRKTLNDWCVFGTPVLFFK